MILGAKSTDREASEIRVWGSPVKAEMNLSNPKPTWEVQPTSRETDGGGRSAGRK